MLKKPGLAQHYQSSYASKLLIRLGDNASGDEAMVGFSLLHTGAVVER